jgi:hypothetical protein
VRGRVVREYVGMGLVAELAARTDARECGRRRAEAEALRAAERREQEADDLVGQVCEATETLTRAALLSAGYHRHHRGEWRRRRHGEQDDAGGDMSG